MKINSRTDETSTTIAELESRLESIATYCINLDSENSRLQNRIVNLEMIIAKMQYNAQQAAAVGTAINTAMSNKVPYTIGGQSGNITITTKP